jgi:hypothetical protein
MRRSFARAASIAVLALTLAVPAYAQDAAPDWHPESSERLIKLPANYLRKSLDRDFAESALGTALQGANTELNNKAKSLADIQAAINRSEGELKIELRHQFLQEKRSYVELMSSRNDLQRKHVRIQVRLLEDMLDRMRPMNGSMSPVREDLIKKQEAARSRFESSLANVDMALFNDSTMKESKYSAKYAENSAAIEQLVARVNAHNMNEQPSMDGETMSKEDYVRQMLADANAETALVDQEGTILGYMAKLVALDAMQLAEETLDPNFTDVAAAEKAGPAANVHFFISN